MIAQPSQVGSHGIEASYITVHLYDSLHNIVHCLYSMHPYT